MSAVKKNLAVVLLLLLTTTLYALDLPTNWFKAGCHPYSYTMGIDTVAGLGGRVASTIKSDVADIDGFGTLMRNSSADEYLGKRIRMSGYLKTKDVSDWSGLWLRIDGKDSRKCLGFDNMHGGKKNRSVKGTTDWKKYEIVLDVPPQATNIAFGALLSGTGQVWFQDINIEVVDESVPTTGSWWATLSVDTLNYIFITLGILSVVVVISLVWFVISRKRKKAK